MCDAGVCALASLIQQGLLRKLKYLFICSNGRVTDEGIIALARAIDMCGLPEMRELKMTGLGEGKVKTLGLSAITHALIKGSPRLCIITMNCRANGAASLRPIVEGMLRAAGREVYTSYEATR